MIRGVFLMGIVATLCFLLLAGCEEKTEAPLPPAAAGRATPPPGKVQVPESAAATDVAQQPKPYVYDPVGRRDPFKPLVTVKPKSPGLVDTAPLTPLQKFDIGQFRLIGVIIGKGEPRAMVIAPDGKSYILRRGVLIGKNSGTVVEINPTAVLVKERYYDFTGVVRESTQEIQLPKREGVQ